MQSSEMQADDRVPKAHFSAVMYFLRQSGGMPPHMEPKNVGRRGGRDKQGRKRHGRTPVFVVKHWADRWDAYVKLHPELLGTEREVMKAGFDNMQAAEMSKQGKAHFSLVMNFLRLAGRHEIGTWKG